MTIVKPPAELQQSCKNRDSKCIHMHYVFDFPALKIKLELLTKGLWLRSTDDAGLFSII